MRRSPAPRELPPPLEIECLKSLWRLGESSVRRVQEEMATRRPLAYTTVMTLLERLLKRGRVARRKQGRTFLYTPLISQTEMRRLAIDELLNLHFDGSHDELRGYLTGREPDPALESADPEPRLDASLL